jgi:predicted alpha/beta superfamily hydrolase
LAAYAEAGDRIRVVVIDASGLVGAGEARPPLYLASSANGWDPASRRCDEIHPDRWVFTLDAATWGNDALEFKFTRGGWDTVEVDSSLQDIANRRLDPEAGEVRLVIEGFADQREEQASPSTVTGRLEIFRFSSEVLGNERSIRVWLPPGYAEAGDERYPVFYLNDGQNLFDEATSFIGIEWGVDETATALIEAGEIPPLIVVGIDNGGAARAQEYNPPGTVFGGRQNHADRYMRFVIDELMPEINARYRTETGPEHTGFGGSSFGGNITLYASMAHPDLFDRALIESPASWIGDGVLLRMAKEHTGGWPQRVFVAMGDDEYGEDTRDRELVQLARDIGSALEGHGLDASRLRLVIGAGAKHNEGAWAERLPEAMRFLWGR